MRQLAHSASTNTYKPRTYSLLTPTMPRNRSSFAASDSTFSYSELDEREDTTGPAYDDPFVSDDELESSDEDTDEENEEQDMDDAASWRVWEPSSDNSETGWRPPDPEREMETTDGADRLRTFQQLPGEAQVRVVVLHQAEGVPIMQAIDEVAAEHRLRLHEQPIQAREARAAAARLMLERVDENLFNHWLRLNILVQALPAEQQETGRRVLRLVSADPRGLKNVYAATSAAVALNNPFIDRSLHAIAVSAHSSNRNSEDLRGLHRYDRSQTLPDPEPVEDPPANICTPNHLLAGEKKLFEASRRMWRALKKHRDIVDQLVDEILTSSSLDDDNPVMKELRQIEPGYSAEEAARQVINRRLGSPAWNDVGTRDLPAMLLGTFFKCVLGTWDRPSWDVLWDVANWEQWHIKSPALAAHKAIKPLLRMAKSLGISVKKSREVLLLDIKDLGPSPASARRERFLHELDEMDTVSHGAGNFDELCRVMRDDILTWPTTVRNRIFTLSMLWKAWESTEMLSGATTVILNPLRMLNSEPTELERPSSLTYLISVRARRRNWLVKNLSRFSLYHHDAVRQFRGLVEGCQNARAKALILEGIPECGYGANLERARDIAKAANLAKPIVDSADMLLAQQLQMEAVSKRIRVLEHQHLEYFRRLYMPTIERILVGRAKEAVDLEILMYQMPIDYHHYCGRADLGPALRKIVDAAEQHEDLEIISELSVAAANEPLEAVLDLIAKHLEDSEGTYLASEEVRLITELLFRFLYLTFEETLITRVDIARCLTRHCWFFGLYRAWMDWQADLCVLVDTLSASLHDSREDWPEHRQGVSADLAAALREPDKDFKAIEILVSREACHLPSSTKVEVFRLFDQLHLLRIATGVYLDLPDRADAYVLPEDFIVGEAGRSWGEDEDALSMVWLHEIVRFDKSVLDGGKASLVDRRAKKFGHNDRLKSWGLEELCERPVDEDCGGGGSAPVVYRY
ncbi:uncharacterized protein BKCO1_6400045 [Diplodia corticola]|uniref:Uncharacterized protein n=1 Tax=Diplodia corticola TaxID=236234 RepID=A0A1J9QQA5_9PEZI|nr:uncharacterized protein BKCO1_6400045 [Diplodia corticola]OJD30210.1 hypothetical protein BKCO1_6400045 [Diplodia corticola]